MNHKQHPNPPPADEFEIRDAATAKCVWARVVAGKEKLVPFDVFLHEIGMHKQAAAMRVRVQRAGGPIES
jgi:hypothetical protein